MSSHTLIKVQASNFLRQGNLVKVEVSYRSRANELQTAGTLIMPKPIWDVLGGLLKPSQRYELEDLTS